MQVRLESALFGVAVCTEMEGNCCVLGGLGVGVSAAEREREEGEQMYNLT